MGRGVGGQFRRGPRPGCEEDGEEGEGVGVNLVILQLPRPSLVCLTCTVDGASPSFAVCFILGLSDSVSSLMLVADIVPTLQR